MVTTLTSSNVALLKAGANVSSALVENDYTVLINQAEAFVNVLSRHNWIDNYATLNADVRLILDEACSNLAAIYFIQYDLDGWISSRAQDKINVLWARFQQCVDILGDPNSATYLRGA